MFGSDEARTHARDLQFELMVDGAPLGEDVYDAANEDFFLYCAWLQDIEAKYELGPRVLFVAGSA
jgi:hypothetical protein